MRLDLYDGEETSRVIGAVVIRPRSGGEISLDIGPADGAPIVSLSMSHLEAARLGKAILQAESGGDESVLIIDT